MTNSNIFLNQFIWGINPDIAQVPVCVLMDRDEVEELA